MADERIVRRPDLDGLCSGAHAAFFMPKWTADVAASTVPPAELSCTSPAQPADPHDRIVENPQGFLGRPYCCPRSRSAPPPHTAGALSCEQAVLEYARHETVADAEDVNAGPFAHILNRGSYFEHCGVPNEMGIDMCVAVVEGRATGVTVRTSPPSAEYAECVAESILRLTFPSSTRMAVARTKY